MKSSNTRFIIVAIIALMSICSYVFLQTVSVAEDTGGAAIELEVKETLQDQNDVQKTEDASEIGLPDVQLLKFVIETGKRFLPAS